MLGMYPCKCTLFVNHIEKEEVQTTLFPSGDFSFFNGHGEDTSYGEILGTNLLEQHCPLEISLSVYSLSSQNFWVTYFLLISENAIVSLVCS